jgi:5-(carboxyamino)imidazole ribonucleotide synthase
MAAVAEETGSTPIPPGQWLGLLGGGQLGRMFAMAAASLGYRVCVVDPDPVSPAAAVCEEHLQAPYDDPEALAALAARCRAVTVEFENVPAVALRSLAERLPVRPAAAAVAVAQDRIVEKRFMVEHGIAVAPYVAVTRREDLEALSPSLLPAILKTARLGYDGKGQATVDCAAAAVTAWQAMGSVPCVLEQRLALELEVSCIVCRGADGVLATLPLIENAHRGGILAVSVVPARVPVAVAARAEAIARRLATALEYVGVLCVEMFLLDDDRVLVNEIAPRPHNSGHFSIDACDASQFELQVRALAAMPLPTPTLLAPAVMLNILGDVWFGGGERAEPRWQDVLAVPGARLHLYGKREPRPGRKMGHVTCLGATPEEALERATAVAAALGIEPPQ